jgi:hypothetical protein
VQKGLYYTITPILRKMTERNGKGESAGWNLLDLDAMWDQDKA